MFSTPDSEGQLSLFSNLSAKNTAKSAPVIDTNLPWIEQPFVCLDTETTGLNAQKNRVIEIAWIQYDKQKEVRAQSKLCKVEQPLPPEIVNITGITDTMLQHANAFKDVSGLLADAIHQSAFIVAYNAPFDRGFIEKEFERIGKKIPDRPWIDPCVFVKELDKFKKGKRLADAALRWGVELKGAHRALADTRATGELLFKLADKIGIHQLNDMVSKQNLWRASQDEQRRKFRNRGGR